MFLISFLLQFQIMNIALSRTKHSELSVQSSRLDSPVSGVLTKNSGASGHQRPADTLKLRQTIEFLIREDQRACTLVSVIFTIVHGY